MYADKFNSIKNRCLCKSPKTKFVRSFSESYMILKTLDMKINKIWSRNPSLFCFLLFIVFEKIDLYPELENCSSHSSSVTQKVSWRTFLPSMHFPAPSGLRPGPHWHWKTSFSKFSGTLRQISSHIWAPSVSQMWVAGVGGGGGWVGSGGFLKISPGG